MIPQYLVFDLRQLFCQQMFTSIYRSVHEHAIRSECECSVEYPVPYHDRCYTWNMTSSVLMKISPRVVNVNHTVQLPQTLDVSTINSLCNRAIN